MAYRALYRQYRPTRFDEVVGQNHITTTLKNQIVSDRIAHAYLFCGTRGTGKTSTARILARAVNCLSPENGEPCGVCEACRAVGEGSSVDITEIDAASNNGVQDVRDLIESAQYAPLSLKRRVFIIDEVHMLSGSAFNALLKTLEEPPAHILFILATTEPQKLPATIISRCQKYEFHRIGLEDIKKTLAGVLTKVGATIENEGLSLIARAAQGGMRDALSLCDQCLSFCGDTVTTRDVFNVLGSMDDGFLFGMGDALLSRDAARALRMLDELITNGRDLSVFTHDLAMHFRALLLAKTCGDCAGLLECTQDAMKRYLAQAKDASLSILTLACDRLLSVQNQIRILPAPRALLESALVHICYPADALSLNALEARVSHLEEGFVPVQAQKSTAAPATASKLAPQSEAAPVKPKATAAAKKAAPEPKETPSAEKGAPSVSASADADAVWRAAIDAIPNMFVQLLAREGIPIKLEDNALTVGFSESDRVKYTSIMNPINFEPVLAALQTVLPEAKLLFVLTKETPHVADEATARAMELFGDKLKLE